jgi:hypothetical protein
MRVRVRLRVRVRVVGELAAYSRTYPTPSVKDWKVALRSYFPNDQVLA